MVLGYGGGLCYWLVICVGCFLLGGGSCKRGVLARISSVTPHILVRTPLMSKKTFFWLVGFLLNVKNLRGSLFLNR